METQTPQIEQYDGIITHICGNGQKPDGWFMCYLRDRTTHDNICLAGKTDIRLEKNERIEGTMCKSVRYSNKNMPTYDVQTLVLVTKTVTGTKNYLKKGPGVSKAVAEKLVKIFGVDAINMIKTDPDSVQQIAGLTDKQIEALTAHVQKSDIRTTLQQKYPEISDRALTKILEYYKDPVDVIENNVYQTMEIQGITFTVADAIAAKQGYPPTSPYRFNHALEHVLKTQNQGNLYVNLSNQSERWNLYNCIQDALKDKRDPNGRQEQLITITDAEFMSRLNMLRQVPESPIYIEEYNNELHLYLTFVHACAQTIISSVKKYNQQKIPQTAENKLKNQMLNYEANNGIQFNKEQREAILNALMNSLSIITGGPGRGKTRIIDCIASCWASMRIAGENTNVCLLAPTGKASAKLSTETGNKFTSMTIDKLLYSAKWHKTGKYATSWMDDTFSNRSNMIIIDESSMIDVVKAAELFKTLGDYDCSYCFVGDADQLPPIEAGDFFKSLIQSNKIPTTRLITPMRNSGLILDNAEKINAKNTDLKYNTHDFIPVIPKDDTDIDSILEDILDQYNDEKTNCPDITQLALLSPIRNSKLGVINLNIRLQDINCPLNPNGVTSFNKLRQIDIYTTKGFPIYSTLYGNTEQHTKIRIKDIVINTKNNSDIQCSYYKNNDFWNCDIDFNRSCKPGIYNGDCGTVIGYIAAADSDDNHEHVIVHFFDDRIVTLDITNGEFEHFELGYALTVHKAQGCEYDTVMLVVPRNMLYMIQTGFGNKNLIYTAVTRAKQRVVILGSKDALDACIQQDLPPRNSNLADKL